MVMVINKNKNIKAILLSAFIVLLSAVAVYYILKPSPSPDRQVDQRYTTGEEDLNNNAPAKTTTDPKSSLPSDNESIPSNNTASISIDELSQSNGQITAKASTVDITVSNCVYNFTSEGARPVVRETKGGCNTISIPSVEFEKIGTYTLTVTAYDEATRISTTKKINVE